MRTYCKIDLTSPAQHIRKSRVNKSVLKVLFCKTALKEVRMVWFGESCIYFPVTGSGREREFIYTLQVVSNC